ncbi:uncharacterized protein LOC136033977 [Artemia franciscana]|uniref:uncharacterized protein LOC136033977 n=1 Tax=Artemia franciscana TaxID=6661 RepID=UPI0032DA5543
MDTIIIVEEDDQLNSSIGRAFVISWGYAFAVGSIGFAVAFGGWIFQQNRSRMPLVASILEVIRLEEVNHGTFSRLLQNIRSDITQAIFSVFARIFIDVIRRVM